MSGICLPIDASNGAPSFPAAQHRVAQAALLAGRSDRPLGALSGVRPGSEPTVTVTSSAWTVTPFTAVVDPGTALTVGPFLVAFLANQTGTVTAADSTNPRVDRLDVQVPDDPAGASALAAVVVYTAGVPGAAPSAPSAPARSFPLGTISVPKAATGSPSFASSFPRTVASGGIVPAPSAALYPAHPYVGQYVDDVAFGLMRFNGAVWAPPSRARMQYEQVTAGQALTSGSFTVITGLTMTVDTFGGASMNAASGAWTCPAAGWYEITAGVSVSTGAARTIAAVLKNANTAAALYSAWISDAGTTSGNAMMPPKEFQLAAGDVLTLTANVNATGIVTTNYHGNQSFIRVVRTG